MTPSQSDLQAFADAVRAASTTNGAKIAIRSVYADLAEVIGARQPLCIASGRCCRFDQYGHRLYISTLEMAAFVSDLATLTAPAPNENRPGGCPFQVSGKLCGVHGIRPFGCRIFFCDPSAAEWQQATYELFHARLKALHDELNVPYYYIEWRQAVAACGL